ncbi:uncharacterized protein LOC127722050 isoform X2 [Mytilus californianus]|uniref:uncharacterized protein LOC127722050 isoform X2 n=1 Tax=Mytilus californianus TaxID=6549 RepID=UPI002245F270|nr:uncharacterized protein LOC127722050 isoform X2 [Mytilus californianus]
MSKRKADGVDMVEDSTISAEQSTLSAVQSTLSEEAKIYIGPPPPPASGAPPMPPHGGPPPQIIRPPPPRPEHFEPYNPEAPAMSRPPPYWTGPPPPLGGPPPQIPPGMFMMHGPPLPPNLNQQRPRDLVNIQTMPNQRNEEYYRRFKTNRRILEEARRKVEEAQRKYEEAQRKHEEEMRKHAMILGTSKRGSLLQLLSNDLVPSFDSRILVVGAYEAGKTTLVSNLIGIGIPRERQSTDGIDVYFGKLLFDMKTQTLLKKTKGIHNFPKAIYQKILSYLKSVEKEDVIPGKTQPDIPNDDVLQKLSDKIDDYEDADSIDLYGDQEVIPIPVLDFAGQIVYHATHQTFITAHGIYLITFNGSRELDDPLSDKEDERKTTILENIRQWVSSILLYSHPDNKDYPRLMFVATHKDLVCEEDVPNKRLQLLTSLSNCFTDENIKSHLMVQKLFFVNALNENDPEMEELRACVSKTITENPQWGQRVPKQFLILEMMFAALVEEGKYIISFEDAVKMNTQIGVESLSSTDLKLFLRVQNICGKMTYFDYPNLENYIVINPTCLIDVLKSIVTAVPSITSLQRGRLTKSDLTKIWSSEKFSHFLQHEEYFRQLLVHYDILSEMKRYDKESGKKMSVDCYLLPCMITKQNTTTYVERHVQSSKCIGFVFDFRDSHVPDAIPSRLIASIISIWNIKRYKDEDLLFSNFVVVVLDRKHDLVVKTESNKIAVYLKHKDRREMIIKDLASSVRQCLEQNLARISEVYSLSFTSDSTSKKYVPFDVKLKSGCPSQDCLLIPESLDGIDTEWICDNHGFRTPKSELDIWYTDRTLLRCTDSCQGVLEAVLSMLLNDSQLLRICNSLTKEEVRSLAVNLGITFPEFDAIDTDSTSMLKFYSLRMCREKNKSCKDFVKAMEAAEINRHTMCQILRQEEVATDLPDKILNLPPSDEILDRLCLRIGKEWMALG